MYMTKINLPRKLETHVIHSHIEDSFTFEHTKDRLHGLKHIWRKDVTQNGQRYILLVSKNKPDTRKMSDLFNSEVITRKYDLAKLDENGIYFFRMSLNTVKSKMHTRKYVPLKNDTERLDFLKRKAERHGFEIVNDQAYIVRHFVDHFTKCHRETPIDATTFEGYLKITDLNKFKEALARGIGREKAYGMGLVTIAKYK